MLFCSHRVTGTRLIWLKLQKNGEKAFKNQEETQEISKKFNESSKYLK